MIELWGPRVLLRALRPDEVDLIWQRQTGLVVGGRPSRDRIEAKVARSGRLVNGRIDLGIEVDARLVGELDARRPEGALPPGVWELGIGLFDEADRGQGVGGEAIGLLVDHLFDEHDAGRVQGSTDVSNTAMRRVFERLGFREEGILRDFMPDGDGRADYAVYGMTRSDRVGR
ncbi:MAG: GNAT family N-acetyltransferase [Gaiellaceae bacterium]